MPVRRFRRSSRTEPPPAPQIADEQTLRRFDALIDARAYEQALPLIDAALRKNANDLGALRRRMRALLSMGELTPALAVIRQMRAVRDNGEFAGRERALVGMLRELDVNFTPLIPGDPEHLEPAAPNRVLHLVKHALPYHTNGYTVRTKYTLLCQQRAGLEPIVVSGLGSPRSDGVASFPPSYDVDGFRHHILDIGPLDYETMPDHDYATAFARAAADVVRAVRPAVIQVHSGYRGYDTALVALALAERFGIPWIYEVRGFLESTWTGDYTREERGEWYRMRVAQEDRCMRAATHVVTIAESMRDEIIERGISPADVTVVPNAVDPASFPPRERDDKLAAKLGLDGKVVLGYISNIGWREGIDQLVEATGILRARGIDVSCVIVGEGPERPNLERLVEERGLHGIVHVVGPVPHDQVGAYYSVIDIFVIPRRDDRAARLVTPLKPYEAMALGKPLLVSALPALLEIAAPDERGLSFEPENIDSLVEQAARMIADPALRARVADNAREWVLRERTWDGNGTRYRDVIDRVVPVGASR